MKILDFLIELLQLLMRIIIMLFIVFFGLFLILVYNLDYFFLINYWSLVNLNAESMLQETLYFILDYSVWSNLVIIDYPYLLLKLLLSSYYYYMEIFFLFFNIFIPLRIQFISVLDEEFFEVILDSFILMLIPMLLMLYEIFEDYINNKYIRNFLYVSTFVIILTIVSSFMEFFSFTEL